MQLSQHFSLAEAIRSDTARELGIDNSPMVPQHRLNLYYTAAQMERVRRVLGNRPIIVSSWYRNPVVNRAVGGVSNSSHALGLAVDFTCRGLSVLDTSRALVASNINFDQLIYEYHRWVHIGFSRTSPRRQVLTKLAGEGYRFGLPG